MHFARKLAVAGIGLFLTAVPVLAADPTGTWQSTTGESRYRVTYCGDGTQLCAKLTWLRDDARTEKNLPYLNKYVVKGAVAASENLWTGELNYAGETFEGKLTMAADDSMKLSGCKGMFCQTMQFVRLESVASLH